MSHDLFEIFHQLNQLHFAGELPLPTLEWNARLSSTAGRFCPGSRRPIFPRAPKIEVASYLRDLSDGHMHIRDTVLHEMIHYLLWHQKKPYGHTSEFHRIMKRVGAKRYNPVPKEKPVKYWYECPGCLKRVPARRKMGMYACAECCETKNGGKFSESFRLRLAPKPPAATPTVIRRPAAAPTLGAANIQSSAEKAQKESAPLPPQEIVRRLEELKKLLVRS